MTSISSIMKTSSSAMSTFQTAVAVTAENLANVESEGYSRQTVTIQESRQTNSTGNGSQVSDVVRVSDQFTQKKLLTTTQDYSSLETESEYLATIEATLGESGEDGLSAALSDFWSSWQEVVNDASDYNARSSVASAAQTLASNFNQIASDLEDTQGEIDSEIVDTVEKINDLTARIASLNDQIGTAAASGKSTNSLDDSMDALLEELSGYTDFSVRWEDDGQVHVELSNGKSLVDGEISYELGTEYDATTGELNITWTDNHGTTATVTDAISGGSLEACLTLRNDTIPSYLEQLDDLAATIITEVNTLLLSGYDYNGTAGVELFSGTSASDIAVNQNILDDPNLIAASATTGGAPGDSTNAEAIADLQNSLTMNGGTVSFEDFFSAMVAQVGADVEELSESLEVQEGLLEFYTSYQESISGVDEDEESANLVLYQQAYEASAKVITILQELMETVLEM